MTLPPVLRVALPVPLPRLFDYLPPPGLDPAEASLQAVVGHRIRVPFGRREAVGLVAATGPAAPGAPELRTATALLDDRPLLDGELLASLRWLARYLHAPLGEVLATALPAALRRGEPLPETHVHGWVLTEAGHTALGGLRAGRPRRLAERLAGGAVEESVLDESVDGWRGAARALAARGLVERIALGPDQRAPAPAAPLDANPEQQAAIEAIRAAGDGVASFLLDGVTGSGKTEVY